MKKNPPLYPNLAILGWLMIALSLVVFPHVPRLAWWIPLVFIVLLAWRFVVTYYQSPLPNLLIRLLLAILILSSVYISYGTIFGRDAGVALLVALIAVKLLEMNTLRDALLICFLGYFLVITNFLYSQSIPTAIYMAGVIVVMTATLISLSDINHRLNIQAKLRLSTTLLLQALPIMLVLFVLFPRVSGPFWSLPKDAHSAVSGLSDSMSIGHLSELSLSNKIAFRVTFKDNHVPPPSQLYWRGPVLWWTNGRDWRSLYRYSLMNEDKLPLKVQGQPYEYTLTLEPHNERWLFALELPTHTPQQLGGMTPDYQILAKYPIQQRIRYTLRSYTDYQATFLHQQLRSIALRLPREQHPKTIALAEEWAEKFQTPQRIVEQALRYFNEQPFHYTLSPPSLPGDPIDQFLFETRRGFCEHYAASFVVLMRAAGIPARVVTGYLGGERNPLGDYLIVRQRDAHAWAEVWFTEEGWVRIDPTGAVSPERVEQGINNAIPQEIDQLDWGVMGFSRNTWVVQWWRQLENSWDALNNGWNQWVLGYGPERQRELLRRLGLGNLDWQGMVIGLVIIIATILSLLGIWTLWRRPAIHDPVQKSYQQFCAKLARQGFIRQPYEGALDFADRVCAQRPQWQERIKQITDLYLSIRYRSQPDLLPALRRAVKRFRV